MNALLIALFCIGVVLGVIRGRSSPPKRRAPLRPSNRLDTVDEMFLYGEVNGDDFYRM